MRIDIDELIGKWVTIENLIAAKLMTIERGSKKYKFIINMNFRLRAAFFIFLSFYGGNRREIFIKNERIYSCIFNEEEEKGFIIFLFRSLIVELFFYIESQCRNGRSGKAVDVLNDVFHGAIPSSINILRLMRNAFHNGVHNHKDQIIIFRDKEFHFQENEAPSNTEPIVILDLIEDAVDRIIESDIS